jgi:hypothetical protein
VEQLAAILAGQLAADLAVAEPVVDSAAAAMVAVVVTGKQLGSAA